MASIYIPKNMAELIELSEKIIQKHGKDTDKSCLKNMNIELLNVKISALKQKHQRYLELKEKADSPRNEIQLELDIHQSQKDISPETIRFYVVQIRDVLKGINRHHIVSLREWGFTVSTNGGEKN